MNHIFGKAIVLTLTFILIQGETNARWVSYMSFDINEEGGELTCPAEEGSNSKVQWKYQVGEWCDFVPVKEHFPHLQESLRDNGFEYKSYVLSPTARPQHAGVYKCVNPETGVEYGVIRLEIIESYGLFWWIFCIAGAIIIVVLIANRQEMKRLRAQHKSQRMSSSV